MHKSFILLSGGLDSSTAFYLANNRNHGEIEAVSIDYGQRHAKELQHAAQVAGMIARASFRVIRLPSGMLSGTMLTDRNASIPEVSYSELPSGISPTYVPFRNGLMLSLLAAHAQRWVGDDDSRSATIMIGAHAEDADRDAYPDCSKPFIEAMADAIQIGTYDRVHLDAPFVGMSKSEIVALGSKLGVPFYATWSCYKGEALHCGKCPTCRARKEAFIKAGVNDPTHYAAA